jgi:hypothetical protein
MRSDHCLALISALRGRHTTVTRSIAVRGAASNATDTTGAGPELRE